VTEPATTTTGLNAKLVITTPRGLETLRTMDVASQFDKSNAPHQHSDDGLLSKTRKIESCIRQDYHFALSNFALRLVETRQFLYDFYETSKYTTSITYDTYVDIFLL